MQFSLKMNVTCSVQSVINTARTATHSATSCLQERTRVPTNWIFKTNEDAARTATRALFIHQRRCRDFGTDESTVFTTLQCPVVQLSSKKRDVSSLPPSLPPLCPQLSQSSNLLRSGLEIWSPATKRHQMNVGRSHRNCQVQAPYANHKLAPLPPKP